MKSEIRPSAYSAFGWRPYLWHTLVLTALTALPLASSRAASRLPLNDHFPYASSGNLGAVGGAGFWTGSSTAAQMANGNLDGAAFNLPASSGFMVAMSSSTGGTYNEFAGSAGDITSGKVYCSFLIKANDASTVSTSGERVVSMNIQNGSSTRFAELWFKNVADTVQIGLAKNGGTPVYVTSGAGSSLVDGNVYFIVFSQEFVTPGASDDVVRLWVNPSSMGGAEDGSPSVIINSGTDITSATGVGRLYFYGGIACNIDEFRMGTTWAEVTPTSGPVVGQKLGFISQPTDTQVNVVMNPVVVQVQSAAGSAAASNNVPITLTLTSGSGNLYGTTTRNTDATGKATFDDLYLDTVGAGKQFTAAASGIGSGLSNAISATFSISVTPPVTGLAITDFRMQPQGLVVNGHNDAPNEFCQILGAIDSHAGTNDWIIVSYQNFNGGGLITFTNPTSPAMPMAFYRLRTGDSTTKTQPPSIGLQPASQIVSPGATATFNVVATGPLLQYLWYFNGNPIPGATSASLVISNAQPGNVGDYSVIVANPAGNTTSAIATLGVGNVAPDITVQPQNQTNTAGSTVLFSVTATGTVPLSYQWYFNTNTLLPSGTNALLTLSNLSTNDAGKYRVHVSNNFGSDTSTDATLVVTPVPTALPDTNMVGWAAFAGVTGGAGGPEVTASDYASFRAYCRQAGPLIIHVQGALVANEAYCYLDEPNKTIIGDGTDAALYGDLRLNATNVIVQNMFFSATNSNSDGITIDNSSSHGTGKYIWVDHCTFYDCTDGSLDITKGADYVTVSWCKFSYAPVPVGTVNHEFVNLIASSDSDNASQYHVTFHHNWYGDYCRERMPSVRFGRVHVFNNYYNCVDNNYCVRTRIDAEVLVENNYFIGVQNPWERFVTGGTPGKLYASGNITNTCKFVNGWTSGAQVIPGNDVLGADLNPPPYTLSPFYWPPLTQSTDVPYYIQTYAGSGKYPYAP